MPVSQAPDRPVARRWILWSTLVFAVLALLPWLGSFGPVSGGAPGILAAVVTTGAMGMVFVLAARNPAQSARLRQALMLQGVSVLLVALGNAVRLAHALGLPVPVIPGVAEVSEFAIWILGFVALVRIPLQPIGRENRWRVAIDITISYIGIAVVLFVLWSLPGMRDAPPSARSRLMFFDLMEAGNLLVLNLILVRGSLPAARTAVAWMAGAVVVDTFYLVAFQYCTAHMIIGPALLDSTFFVDIFVYTVAGLYFLESPPSKEQVAPHSALLQIINPLPFCAVLGVGGLLILSAVDRANPSVVVLAAGEVLMAALLVVRVAASTLESLRLAREKAEIERRAETQKMEIIKRLSGGVSHVINNLMTVVLGNAQLLRSGTPPTSPDVESIDAISKAAQDASRLAGRLGLASGNKQRGDEPRPLADVVLSRRDAVIRIVGMKRDVLWDVPDSQGRALVAPADAEVIVSELVSNAGEATYHAGRITIRIRDEMVPEGAPHCASTGLHSVLEVSDTGRGISRDDLPRVVEPFFSNRPFHEGRGLGLSVVQGIVSRYRGSLLIETVPGTGSVVRVFLPVGGPAEAP